MDCLIKHGWKLIVALGGSISLYKLVSKLDSEGAKEVLTNAVNACKESAIAIFGNG